ncbi:MAG TPA: 16S rRNA (uracil(1498)-N(3))-methyltransferase [Pyrinomonadaceae bacterium]|jgi:16S rRNA (uracil1498-N3)-methyltransferase
MTRRRFFAPPEAFATDGSNVTLASEETRHLRDVLRLKAGDEVFVFDGAGREYRCTVEECRRDSTTLKLCAGVAPAHRESPLGLTLAVALLKGEKFDLVVQKATELGVARIVPVLTKHADVRLRDETDAARRLARWRRVALEAAKQSGRALVPQVAAPLALASLLGAAWAGDAEWRVIFAERGGRTLSAEMAALHTRPHVLTALVGSEGGWAEEELALALDAGWSAVTLGGRTLRAETAAIAVAVLLQHQFGDLV